MPSVDAFAVLSLDDAKAAVNDEYELELAGGTVVNDGNVSTATYSAVPKGSGDPIIVKVINRTASISADDIWNDYENARLSRPSSELIEGIGYDAYIAYPSIHVYDRGCEIVITASSGSGDKQKEMLKDLAKTATEKLEVIIPEEEEAIQ